jgi:hypothetical protein
MRWNPKAGHVPRGFSGATGALEEVRLVLITAEPGDPHDTESHPSDPESALTSAYNYAYVCLSDGKDLFHRNIRHIMQLCWPNKSFAEHMRLTWMTESVLCSAEKEAGSVPARIAAVCRKHYLKKQLALFPNALIVTLGLKAANRLAGRQFIAAGAAAPPGCNRKEVRESWNEVAREIQRRML